VEVKTIGLRKAGIAAQNPNIMADQNIKEPRIAKHRKAGTGKEGKITGFLTVKAKRKYTTAKNPEAFQFVDQVCSSN
jgi:hypothetical protein